MPVIRTELESMFFRILLIAVFFFALDTPLFANPTQYGSSGLLNIPTAETLDSSNFCFGVWGNCSKKSDVGINTIMPVSITLGIGTFWEIYGAYPNVYLNDDTPYSGRGTADIGTKLRVIGNRSSKFKLAADLHLSRYVDDNPRYNGKNDIGGRLIGSLRTDLLAAHLYGGYMSNAESRNVDAGLKSRKEYPVGAGVDFIPSTRTKVTFELMAADALTSTAPIEAALGFQFYLTPHLTFNLSTGMGLNAAAPDWRVIFGLTTCQGVGAYIKPIPPVKIKNPLKTVEIKPTKVVPLSPLLIKTPAITPQVSKLEIPVDAEGDEILIRPYGNIVIPPQSAAVSVTLPKMVKAVQPAVTEPALAAAEPTPAAVAPLVSSLPSEGSTDFALTRVSGVTPLYGVSMKGKIAPIEKLPGTALTAYRKFRLPDTIFEFDNAELMPEVQKSVSELAEFIRKDSKWVFLRIDGHTDAVGSVKYNMDLSLRRAITVANYLITHDGIDSSRIFVRGMGKSVPIADNSTDEGRKLNRRFEIVFLVHKEEKPK